MKGVCWKHCQQQEQGWGEARVRAGGGCWVLCLFLPPAGSAGRRDEQLRSTCCVAAEGGDAVGEDEPVR